MQKRTDLLHISASAVSTTKDRGLYIRNNPKFWQGYDLFESLDVFQILQWLL